MIILLSAVGSIVANSNVTLIGHESNIILIQLSHTQSTYSYGTMVKSSPIISNQTMKIQKYCYSSVDECIDNTVHKPCHTYCVPGNF